MSANLGYRWDLAVHDRDGQLTLAVEVKSKTNTSPEWAARLRSNILAHGTFPKTPYFLMVFPDRFYLWTDAEVHSAQSEPNYVVDAHSILQPYFERAGVTPSQISELSLELIVSAWLGEIIHSQKSSEDGEESHSWLIDSGLRTALSGGKLYQQGAV